MVEWLARFILLVLFALSVWGWTVILAKRNFFKLLERQDSIDELKKLILQHSGQELKIQLVQKQGFHVQVLKEMMAAKDELSADKRVNSFIISERKKWDEGMSLLGTLGATTPFIGLLGTIMGVIVSFGHLSLGSGDMNQVMYSLAEALVVTAVGLMVAIPSVVAFNYFARKTKNLLVDSECITDFYLSHKKS